VGGERASFELVERHPLEALCNLTNLTGNEVAGRLLASVNVALKLKPKKIEQGCLAVLTLCSLISWSVK
jgi:hypothetical protein